MPNGYAAPGKGLSYHLEHFINNNYSIFETWVLQGELSSKFYCFCLINESRDLPPKE